MGQAGEGSGQGHACHCGGIAGKTGQHQQGLANSVGNDSATSVGGRLGLGSLIIPLGSDRALLKPGS